MKLLFRQRFFSWFDSYDIYGEAGETLYTVKGQLSWGHCLKIFDAAGREVGTVRERVFHFLPCFELYCGTQYSGCVRRLLTFFRPQYTVECNGWQVQGDLFGWEYTVATADGRPGGHCLQAAVPVDGHLWHRGGAAGGCPVCTDAGAGH